MKRLLALAFLFLRPAGLDFSSAFAGVTGGLLGMKNASQIAQPSYYKPQYANQADEAWFAAQEAIKAATNRNTGLVDPVLLESFSKMLGIDLAPLAAAGTTAGQQFGQTADQAGYFGDTMAGQAKDAFSRSANIWDTARDPRNELHDRTKQRVVEGARAADSARGIGMSAVSAGNENQAVRDFEIDWQTQQLARQLAGSQGANQAGVLGGADVSSSMGYYGMQPGLTMQSAYAPIQAQQTQYQLPMDWATMFSQAQGANVQGPQAGVAAGYYPYIGGATNAASTQFQNQYQADIGQNTMQQQSLYGLFGGGQSPTPFMGGNSSGFGNPANWWSPPSAGSTNPAVSGFYG